MTELLQWWNLIFVLPAIGAIFYILGLASGMVSVEHDTNVDVATDTDLGLDGHGLEPGGAGLEHNVDAGHDSDAGLLIRALSFLGVGKTPLSIIVISWCLLWGFIGYASNTILGYILPGWINVWPSIVVAMLLSLSLTKWLAHFIGSIMPTTETYGTTKKDLVGRWAEATTKVTSDFGQAMVRDQYDNLHTVKVVTKPDEEPITKGSQVLLLFYDAGDDTFQVGKELPVPAPNQL